MRIFRPSRRKRPRAVIIGLDGTPYSLIRRLVKTGKMPNLGGLFERGSIFPMKSVVPTVSSVAWASIVTGCNPGRHDIFGFIDRHPQSHEMFIPSSRNLKAKTWIDVLSGMGKRVFSMGVPMTYPPKAVNGVLISGFMAPSLRNATYPLDVEKELEAMGYVIDIDAWQAREDKAKFLDELFGAFERRCEAMFTFLAREPWDFFVTHVMDTDRLNHFLWGPMEDEREDLAPWFYKFYARVDEAIGELVRRLDEDVLLMILSDHGFCRLKQEVHLNHWLRQAGYLRFNTETPRQLRDMLPSTRCYSLLPGRFYVCVRGRERFGCVGKGREYESVRGEIAGGLLELRDPENGQKVIQEVLMREEICDRPIEDTPPDFLAIPVPGYDLKGGFDKRVLMEKSPVTGTHTLDDAMFYVNRKANADASLCVTDVMPTLLGQMEVAVPEGVDGRAIDIG